MRVIALILLAGLAASATAGVAPVSSPPEVTADSLYDAGAMDSLLAYSKRIIARAEARGDSVLLGRMIYRRGRARLALRESHAAEDFDRALAIATALDDSLGRMHALGLKSFVAVNQAHFDESIQLNEERIRLARALGRRGSEGWGHLLVGYAELYRENFAVSQAEYEAAWRAFADVNRPREQLTASIGLARALEHQRHYDGARTSLQRAWITARELNDRAQEADVINNLGAMEQEHGELSMAARYFQRSFEIKRELKAFDIANVAHNVANADRMIGRYAHAESTLVEAMALGKSGMLDSGMEVEIGRMRLARGRSEGAARCFRDVLAHRDRAAPASRIEAVTYLAEALVASDSLPAAISLMDDEFQRLHLAQPSAPRTQAFLVWSRCVRSGGDPARARTSALAAWSDAQARRDSTMMVPAASEMSLCERALGHNSQAFDWLEQARHGFEVSRAAGEFQWREARRATLSRALIECGDVLRVYPPDASREARDRSLFDFFQQVDSRTLLERVTDPRRFEDIDPVLARPTTSKDLQTRVLRPGECFFRASVGGGRIYVFVLTPDDFRARVIDDTKGLLTARVRNYVRVCARAPADDVAPADVASRALGELFFADVADVLQASTRIYTALDGNLAGAPFETLVCPGESGPLIATHEIVRVPSAAILQYLRARPAGAPPVSTILAAAGDADVLAGARAEVNLLSSRYGAMRAVSPDREDFLESISHFDVIHIASHVHVDSERPWHSGILISPAIAAKAAGDGADSTAAGPLALSAADSSQIAAGLPADPFVRASEIANRRLGARLVVLSACESALGRPALAEGVLGIASSFVSAGSRTVVASLWDVDDRTTADLMERFYKELARGCTTAAALRTAQLAVRARKPAPFFWAGFVVIGDGDVAVALHPRPSHGKLLGLAVIGLTVMVTVPWAVWRGRARRVRIAA